MKRIVALLLALSMIIAASFALSSCELISGIIPENQEDETPDNIEDGGNTDNGNKDENVDTTPEVRTTITEAEWEEFCNYTNYTVSSVAEIKYCDPTTGEILVDSTGSLMQATLTQEHWITENACCFQDYNGSIGMFNVLKDGVWYQLHEYEDGYKGIPLSDYSHGFFKFSNVDYKELVYDEVKGTYKAVDDAIWGGSDCFLYFENGKIIKMEILQILTNDSNMMYFKQIGTFNNIGTTVIEIPEFTISE